MKSATHSKAIILSALIAGVFACSGLLPKTEAVVPAPDGGYPGGNTAEGQNALFSLTTGQFNTGVGFFSLRANATGQFNTAIGAGTLLANTADRNTAVGAGVLLSNGTGHDNTATGVFALINNTTGNDNTANGGGALFHNIDGFSNTAMGTNPLFANTSGNFNTAIGDSTLSANTTGSFNIALGGGALLSNTVGHDNTAVGVSALQLNTTGSNNIALGSGAGLNITSGDNNIYIGHPGVNGQNNTINIGTAGTHSAVFINGIFGASTISGIPVYIDGFSQLGTVSSSRRFKEEIKPMEKASEAILALKPVTFHYKSDKSNTPQFGLIAEDVAEVNPALIVRDKEGKPYSVRYDQVNAMLLNEFLKEHKKVEEQQSKIDKQAATIAELQSAIAQQQKSLAEEKAQIEALTSGLQKVSTQLDLQKQPDRTVAKY